MGQAARGATVRRAGPSRKAVSHHCHRQCHVCGAARRAAAGAGAPPGSTIRGHPIHVRRRPRRLAQHTRQRAQCNHNQQCWYNLPYLRLVEAEPPDHSCREGGKSEYVPLAQEPPRRTHHSLVFSNARSAGVHWTMALCEHTHTRSPSAPAPLRAQTMGMSAIRWYLMCLSMKVKGRRW